jgi:hypothetical protein
MGGSLVGGQLGSKKEVARGTLLQISTHTQFLNSIDSNSQCFPPSECDWQRSLPSRSHECGNARHQSNFHFERALLRNKPAENPAARNHRRNIFGT